MSRGKALGFSLIELMIAVIIVGTLSSIAVPKYRQVRRQATATQIVGDYDVVRHAAFSFFVDSGYFPKEAGAAAIPKGLVKYLPNKYTFKKKNWTLDYENWTTKTGKAYKNSGIVIGVSFTTPDTSLGRTAMTMVGNTPTFTVGNKYTFMISGF